MKHITECLAVAFATFPALLQLSGPDDDLERGKLNGIDLAKAAL